MKAGLFSTAWVLRVVIFTYLLFFVLAAFDVAGFFRLVSEAWPALGGFLIALLGEKHLRKRLEVPMLEPAPTEAVGYVLVQPEDEEDE